VKKFLDISERKSSPARMRQEKRQVGSSSCGILTSESGEASSCLCAENDVLTGPLSESGPVKTSSATSSDRRETDRRGEAGGVTARRFAGAPPANSHRHVGGRSLTSLECSALIMRGDLDLAIRDLSRCRQYVWLSQELRCQLGRCLYELHTARRMAL
jgi:hypothetical protein